MSNEFDDYDDEYERPELDPPDPDADDPRVKRKRRRRAPSVASGETSDEKVDSPAVAVAEKPKPGEEDWGFEDEDEGGIAEWKLGLVLVLVLIGGFGFVAWRKYDTIKAIAQAKLEEFSENGASETDEGAAQTVAADDTPFNGVELAPPDKPRTDGITTADSSIATNAVNGNKRGDRSTASFTSLGPLKDAPKKTASVEGAVPPPSDASNWDVSTKSSPTLAKKKDDITFDFGSPASQTEPNRSTPKTELAAKTLDVFNFADAKAGQTKPMSLTPNTGTQTSLAGSTPATSNLSLGLEPLDSQNDPFIGASSQSSIQPPMGAKPVVKATAPAAKPMFDKPLAEIASSDPFGLPAIDDPFGADLPDLSKQEPASNTKKPVATLPEDPFGLPTQPKPAAKPLANLDEPLSFDLPDVTAQAKDVVEQWSPKPKSSGKSKQPTPSLGLEPLPEDPFSLEPLVNKPLPRQTGPVATKPTTSQPFSAPKKTPSNLEVAGDPFGLDPIALPPKQQNQTPVGLPDDPFGLPPVSTTPTQTNVMLPEPANRRSDFLPNQRGASTQPPMSTQPSGFGSQPAPIANRPPQQTPEPSAGPQRVDTAIATRRYKVGDGENYWAISKNQYGTVRYFAALAVWNKKVVEDPRHLRPGMTIELPPADLLEPLVKTANLPTVSPRSSNPMATLRPEAHTARQHRVGTGESYWSISKSQYGSSRYFAALAEWNKVRIPDPRRLKAGTIIDLPAAKDLEPLVASASPNGPAPPKSTDTGANGFFKTAKGEPRYRVGPNETLTGIAQKTLGRASRWRQIYAMNGDVLTSSERIAKGVVLRLPPDSLRVAGGQ